jgi:hypothetical protein
MPYTKIFTTISQNGVEIPLNCTIFEGEGSGPSVTLEGGPFSGERYTRYDLTNLIMELQDLCTTMKEVADGAKI